MVKKSRRFAVRQSALAKRKKSRLGLSQRQRELSGVPTQPEPSEAADATDASLSSSDASVDQDILPVEEAAMQAVPAAPWRYNYVLSDIKRIGLIAAVVATLLVVLTFLLG